MSKVLLNKQDPILRLNPYQSGHLTLQPHLTTYCMLSDVKNLNANIVKIALRTKTDLNGQQFCYNIGKGSNYHKNVENLKVYLQMQRLRESVKLLFKGCCQGLTKESKIQKLKQIKIQRLEPRAWSFDLNKNLNIIGTWKILDSGKSFLE